VNGTQSNVIDLKALALSTGGGVSSICSTDYASYLNQIADATAAKTAGYALSKHPVSASIAVKVNGVLIAPTVSPATGTTGYQYKSDSNKIVFTGVIPAAGASIEVTYNTID
jgi:hypothetical protein